MATRPKKAKRYSVISVPGREDDGSDTTWYAFDNHIRTTIGSGGAGEEGRKVAAQLAREANRSNDLSTYGELHNRIGWDWFSIDGLAEADADEVHDFSLTAGQLRDAITAAFQAGQYDQRQMDA
jgi:hypothetical protein